MVKNWINGNKIMADVLNVFLVMRCKVLILMVRLADEHPIQQKKMLVKHQEKCLDSRKKEVKKEKDY